MAEKAEPSNNYARLLRHLGDNSFAALLVRAHASRDPANPTKSIEAVLQARLNQVREYIDSAQD